MTQPASEGTSAGVSSVGATVDQLAAAVVALYADAEQRLLASLATVARHGLTDSAAAGQAAMLAQMRRAAERVATQLRLRTGPLAQQVIREAAQRGDAAATDQIRQAVTGHPSLARLYLSRQGHRIASANAIATDLADRLDATTRRIVRFADDAYRAATAEASTRLVLGRENLTPVTGQRLAWSELTRSGVTGYTDTAGRNWDLSSYVEMATRSTVQRAYNASHEQRMRSVGIDYFTVSRDGHPCKLCVAPGTVVSGPAPIGAVRTEYRGDLITIRTASGKELTATPNHSVLTVTGWRRVENLTPGDQLVNDGGQQRISAVTVPDHIQMPTRIEDVVKPGLPFLLARPATSDLDGDIAYREVDVVRADCDLLDELDLALAEPFGDHLLIPRVGAAATCLCKRRAPLGLNGARNATARLMSGSDQRSTASRVERIPAPLHSLAALGREDGRVHGIQPGLQRVMSRPSAYASASQVIADYPTADAEGGAELLRALASDVTADEIISLSVAEFSGHVWDIQTGQNWYSSNGIISHNCRPWEGSILGAAPGEITAPAADSDRQVTFTVSASLAEAKAAGLLHPNCRHTLLPYLPGVTRAGGMRRWTPADEQRYRATQRLRYLERQVRAWKRAQAGALDDLERQRAGRHVRAYQAKIRGHVERHGLVRRRRREQLNLGNH